MAIQRNKLVSFVQSELNARYGLDLKIDGRVGPSTMRALNGVTAIPQTFSKGRRFIAFVQYLSHLEPQIDDIAIDGYAGPDTEHVMEQLQAISATGQYNYWRDDLVSAPFHDWPTYDNLESFYGKPGTRQTRVTVPYTLKLAWDLDRNITRFGCHELVVEPIQQAMEEILSVYGLSGIEELKLDYWGGCYNNRRMRGGRKLSTHAWGIAIDWAPQYNKMKWGPDKAMFAKSEYEPFWEAWEKTGAQSYGRSGPRKIDFMHLQYSKF